MAEHEADVPYGENFHDEGAARAWAEAAARKRPFRALIFQHLASLVNARSTSTLRVLELGSGPGFLAEHILEHCPSVAQYTLLDFAQPMLDQSRSRLAQHASRTRFLPADFKTENWPKEAGGPFDVILSLQAVHELRHKRHAARLYAQVHSLLSPGGEFFVCDHLPEGAHTPLHVVLYMSLSENAVALASSGFSHSEVVWSEHRMALHRALA